MSTSREAMEIRGRLAKANRLIDVLVSSSLTGDDVRLLVSTDAPVLASVVTQAGVSAPSPATWETVAVLLDERRRLLAWAATQVPSDPFSVFS